MKVIGVYGNYTKLKQIAKSLNLKAREIKLYKSINKITRYEENTIPVIWVPQTKNKEDGVINIHGEQGLFAFNNSGCINNPKVKDRLIQDINKASTLGYKEVILDAFRYPSPHDQVMFLSCFCKYCTSKQPKLHKIRLKLKEAIKKKQPKTFLQALQELMETRTTLVKEQLTEVHEIAEKQDIKLHTALFPPTLSKLVGQDYKTFKKHVKQIQVMLYHKCSGPACLNHEIASLIKLLRKLELDTRTILQELNIPAINPETLEQQGTPINMVVRELEKAITYNENKIIPIFWANSKLQEIINKAKQETSINKIILFIP